MFSSSTLGALLGVMITISSIPNASSYTKYGRTCKDIGCRRDEVCVMAEDPCSIYQRDNCGRYPTCTKTHPGEANCASTVCGENEYCRTEDGVPKCVKKSTAIVCPTQRPRWNKPSRFKPTTPSPPSRFATNGNGGRISGNSGSRNTIGNGSIFDRLFGDRRISGSRSSTTTPRSRFQPSGSSGYYNTHTSADNQGNRIWRFSG